VEDICLRAGCSKGAFYFHFGDKQALLVSLLCEGFIRGPYGHQRARGLWADRVLLETWAEARWCKRLRRESARQLREISGLHSRPAGGPVAALASALCAGLVVRRVVQPLSPATDVTMLARMGMEAAA
jgi:hypothetical protein